MITLVFGTSNQHKLSEARELLQGKVKLLSLADIGFMEELPETQGSIVGNASEKSSYLYHKLNRDCFAEDTGLEVECLNGAPGVHSARFAVNEVGEGNINKQTIDFLNVELLLKRMRGNSNRRARFKTVISLFQKGNEFFFEGILNGCICEERYGTGGFGYDPIFRPDGYDKTLAEIGFEEKNKISHRYIAFTKLMTFLGKKF